MGLVTGIKHVICIANKQETFGNGEPRHPYDVIEWQQPNDLRPAVAINGIALIHDVCSVKECLPRDFSIYS